MSFEQKNIQFIISDINCKTAPADEVYKLVGRDSLEAWQNKDLTDPSNKINAQAIYVNDIVTPISTPTANGNIMVYNSTTQKLDWAQAAPGTYDKLLVDMRIRMITGILTAGNVLTYNGTSLEFLPPAPNDNLVVAGVTIPIDGGAQIGTRMQFDGANLVFTPQPGTNRVVRCTNTQPLDTYPNFVSIDFSLNGGNNGRRKLTITGSLLNFDGISIGINFRVLISGSADPLWNGIYYLESITFGPPNTYVFQLALDAYTMATMDVISVSDGYLNKGAQFVVTSAPSMNGAYIFGRSSIVTGAVIGTTGRITTNTYVGENSGGDNNFITVDVTAIGYDCNNCTSPPRPYTFETASAGTRAAYNASGYQCVFLGCDAGNAPVKQVQDFDANDFMINIGYKSGVGDLPGRRSIVVSNWANDTYPRMVDSIQLLSNCEYNSLDPNLYAVCIGTSCSITGGSTDVVQIGTNCTTNFAVESVIIGDHTTIDPGSTGSVCIGSYASVFTRSVSVGSNATSDTNGVAIGYYALGTFGVAIGELANSTSGVAIGKSTQAFPQSTTTVGWTAAPSSSGINTTALGYTAGTTLTTGTGCTLVGASANVSTAGAIDRIAIGRVVTNTVNSSVIIGNNAVSYITANATGFIGQGFYQVAPATAKTDVGNYTITAEEMQPGSVIVSTSQIGPETWTTATAALIIARLPRYSVNSSYLFYLRNEGTETITLAAGTGVTFGSGLYTIVTLRCVTFKVTVTGAATVTIQRMMTAML